MTSIESDEGATVAVAGAEATTRTGAAPMTAVCVGVIEELVALTVELEIA